MPTVRIEYLPNRGHEQIIGILADRLPGIVAPQMNIGGRELHDGGVGTSEILVDATAYTVFARNVNDIQITVIAHAFEERKKRIDEATEAVKDGVKAVLADFEQDRLTYGGLSLASAKIGVSIWLIDMGYATIK